MSFEIPAECSAFVQNLLASGAYQSEAQVVSAALTLMQKRDAKLAELRSELQPALEEIQRGEVVDFDVEDIVRRGMERLAKEQSATLS